MLTPPIECQRSSLTKWTVFPRTHPDHPDHLDHICSCTSCPWPLTTASDLLMSKETGEVNKAVKPTDLTHVGKTSQVWAQRTGCQLSTGKCTDKVPVPTKGQALPLPALFKVLCQQTGRMAQQGKALTIKPDVLSSMPRTHMVEG